MRTSVYAVVHFFRQNGQARIDRVRAPVRDLIILQLYFPGLGKRYLALCLFPGTFGLTLTESPPREGAGPDSDHWQSLRLHLRGGWITGCRAAVSAKGAVLALSGLRAVGMTVVQGQLTLHSAAGEALWSLSGKRDPAVLRETVDEPPPGALLGVEALDALLFGLERERILSRLRQEGKRVERALQMAGQDLLRFSTSLELLEQAELLKSQLFKVTRGMRRVELDDYYHPGRKVSLELDPLLSPVENMERIFKKAGKYKRGFSLAREREDALRRELGAVREQMERAEALSPEDPEALRAFSKAPLRARKGARQETAGSPWSRFELDGWVVLLGRNDRGNETVTFRLSRGNDIWLHARNYPGAHVVVRAPGKAGPVPDALLEKAAKLALYYSGAREAGKEEVVAIPVKHVRKIPGGRPGQVTYGSGRTLVVSLEAGFRPGDLFPENRDT